MQFDQKVIGTTIAVGCLFLIFYFNTNYIAAIKDSVVENANFASLIVKKQEMSKKSDQRTCETPPLNDLHDFFNYGKNNGKLTCKYLAEVGGDFRGRIGIWPYHEGSRMVCLDEIEDGDCVILSFGISYDPSFDYDIHRISSCRVYMFDPTVAEDYFKPRPNITFFRLGVSDKEENITILGETVKVVRYESILHMLNLTNHIIDYLKVDIEGFEMNLFDDILNRTPYLLENVGQIAIELQPIMSKGNKTLHEIFYSNWELMHQLECHGFEVISFIPNLFPPCKFEYNNKTVYGCYDVVFNRKS